jgi:hypothetical protein
MGFPIGTVAGDVRLSDQQTGMCVLLQILGVHRHATDKEDGTTGIVDSERHH